MEFEGAAIARFHFKADRAAEFSQDGNDIVEMQFEDVDELIEYCREFEDALLNVLVLLGKEVIQLSDFNIQS
jgi:hypothetical protein